MSNLVFRVLSRYSQTQQGVFPPLEPKFVPLSQAHCPQTRQPNGLLHRWTVILVSQALHPLADEGSRVSVGCGLRSLPKGGAPATTGIRQRSRELSCWLYLANHPRCRCAELAVQLQQRGPQILLSVEEAVHSVILSSDHKLRLAIV